MKIISEWAVIAASPLGLTNERLQFLSAWIIICNKGKVDYPMWWGRDQKLQLAENVCAKERAPNPFDPTSQCPAE